MNYVMVLSEFGAKFVIIASKIGKGVADFKTVLSQL